MSVAMLSQKYIVWKDGMIASNDEINDLLREIKQVRDEIKKLDKIEKDLMNRLYLMVGENDIIADPFTGDTLAEWRYTKDGVQFDTSRFKEERKALYNEYLIPKKGSRRLSVKI